MFSEQQPKQSMLVKLKQWNYIREQNINQLFENAEK